MKPTGKEIYKSGHYVQFFKPDDQSNPFKKIYQQKREDVLRFVNGLSGEVKILDVGGGMGRISNAMVQKFGIKAFLGDLSLDMLELAKKNGEGKKVPFYINLDAEYLPFKDNAFHLIVGLDLFCHLKNQKAGLDEFNRVLRKNGLLVLDSTNSNPIWVFFYPKYLGFNPVKWLKIIFLGGRLPGWENLVKHYRKSQFVAFLKEAGFYMENLWNYGPVICPKWHLAIARKTEKDKLP